MTERPATVPICEACWLIEEGGRRFVRLTEPDIEGDPETCYRCQQPTRSGIYVAAAAARDRCIVRSPDAQDGDEIHRPLRSQAVGSAGDGTAGSRREGCVMGAVITLFTEDELALLADALARAASRHESQGHVTAGRFRAEHDETAAAMRKLRVKITNLAGGKVSNP